MRTLTFVCLFFLTSFITLHAQVKIGENPQAIDPFSLLELESGSRSLVITRMSNTQMVNMTPLRGALVYNTDEGCVFYYNGNLWNNLCENTTNVSLELNGSELILTDSDGNSIGVTLDGAIEQTFTTDPIINFNETIVITQDNNNFNFEVSQITGENIVDSSINGIDLQDNSITANKLAPNSVGQEELQDNTVADLEIDYSQVTLNDFTNDAGYITSAQLISANPNNSIIDDNGAFYDDSLLQATLANTSQQLADHLLDDNDFDPDNERVTGFELDVVTSELVLTEGGVIRRVDISAFGNSGTDDQNLEEVLTENNSAAGFTITDLGTPNLDSDAATKEYVDDAVAGVGGGADGAITLVELDGTDLNFTATGTGFTGTVPLASLGGGTGDDNQQLTLVGNQLTLEDGGAPIDLVPYLDNTDAQNLSLTGNTLNISGGTGVDLTPILNGDDDQNASEVPFTPYLSIGAIDTQNAIQELKDEVDAIVTSGGGNPIDELQDLNLAGSILTLTNPATVGNQVDLGPLLSSIDTNTTNTSLTQDGTDLILTDSENNTVTIPLVDLDSGTDENTTNASMTEDGTDLILTDSENNTVTIPLATLAAAIDTDTNTTNTSLTQDGTDLILTDSENNTVTIPLTELSSGLDENTTNVSMTEDGTDLILTDSENNTVTIPLATLATAINTDDQVASAVPITDAADNFTATNVEDALIELINSGTVDTNFAANNLTLNAARTHDLSGNDLSFIGTGNVGIGTDTPDRKLDVEGEIRGNGFSSSSGTANEPAYSFSEGDDANTGMYRENADQLGFSAGGERAMLISELTNDTNVLIDDSLELDGVLVDNSGSSGTGGQVLVSLGTGVEWQDVAGAGPDDNDFVIQTGSQVTGENLTLAVQNQANVVVDFSTFALDTDLDALLPDDSAADDGDVLTTDGAGNLSWETIVSGGALTPGDGIDIAGAVISVEPDGSTINFNGTGQLQVASGGIETEQIAERTIGNINLGQMGATNGQVLKWNQGNLLWEPQDDDTGAAGTVTTDNTTIIGDGNGTALSVPNQGIGSAQIANEAVTNAKIPDNEIRPVKLEAGNEGEVLTVNGGVVQWGPVAGDGNDFVTGGTFDDTDQEINLTNNGGTAGANPIDVSALVTQTELNTAISGLVIQSAQIEDGTIINDDINAGAAIDGTKINPDFGAQNVLTTGDFIDNGIIIAAPDFVFQKYFTGFSELKNDYEFKSLKEIEEFVKMNNHLPGVRSAYEIRESGEYRLTESSLIHLEKIEELFLHTIEQEKKIETLQAENEKLGEEMEAMKKDMELIKQLLVQKSND